MKTLTTKLNTLWQMCFALAAVGLFTAMPDLALAGGGGDPLGQALCGIVSILNTGTFKALATIAIIVLGIGALMGKISWGMAIMVILGIVLIFGAATIVTSTIGTGTAGGGVTVQGC